MIIRRSFLFCFHFFDAICHPVFVHWFQRFVRRCISSHWKCSCRWTIWIPCPQIAFLVGKSVHWFGSGVFWTVYWGVLKDWESSEFSVCFYIGSERHWHSMYLMASCFVGFVFVGWIVQSRHLKLSSLLWINGSTMIKSQDFTSWLFKMFLD